MGADVPIGAPVSLNGAGNVEAHGGAVGIVFALLEAPSGNAVALVISGTTARLTPDLAGTYKVRVRAGAASGLHADAVHTFVAAPAATPVAVATSVNTVGTSSTLAAAVGAFTNNTTAPSASHPMWRARTRCSTR